MIKFVLAMKWVFVPALVMFALAEGHSLTYQTSTSSQTTASKKKSPAKNSSSASSKRRRKPQPAAYQLHPDPERYQEIQKALSEKGYFKGEVNGQWSDDSVDALKRFQADQKLEPDGKISSLTLIALGLGPKHEGSAPTPPANVPDASVPPAPPSTPRPPQ